LIGPYAGESLRPRFIVYIEQDVNELLANILNWVPLLKEFITSGANFLMLKQFPCVDIFRYCPLLNSEPFALLPFEAVLAQDISSLEKERLKKAKLPRELKHLDEAGMHRIKIVTGAQWGEWPVGIYRLSNPIPFLPKAAAPSMKPRSSMFEVRSSKVT